MWLIYRRKDCVLTGLIEREEHSRIIHVVTSNDFGVEIYSYDKERLETQTQTIGLADDN